MYQIGFVIITWNSGEYIQKCLSALCSLNPEIFHCCTAIVDNGSSDRTRELIRDAIEHNKNDATFDVIELDKNHGTTYSRNIGIKALLSKSEPPEFVCVLDSDTEINSDALATMCRYAKGNPGYGIVGPRMHNIEMVYQKSGRNIPTLFEKICKVLPAKIFREKGEKMQTSIPMDGSGCVEVGYLMSACWLMRTDVMREIGLLDEKIFYAPEDVDYCIRSWKAGYRVMYCYDAEIVHLWQRISRQKLVSRHNFEQLKGLGYLFRKYHYAFSTEKLWESFDQAVSEREKLQRGESS